ncbi:MAG: NAD-dependent deacetylase sirtuin 4 [Myxococcota bacterium]|jgi:NAD-dependent deacetylase sirtuin 4
MDDVLEELVGLMRGRRVAALTGAGCSTESGIPDYRGPLTRHKTRNPIQYRAFMGDPALQARYWARSAVGWPRMAAAQPNPAHHALAAMERGGALLGVITQNVDRLHRRAGSRRVVELHGALAEVRCLSCGLLEAREALQQRLIEANPGWAEQQAVAAPDGDAELAAGWSERFEAVGCIGCAGVLKPDVVFFGEAVPRPVRNAAGWMLDEAEVLLVVGSSLEVFSGYRFVRRAAKEGRAVAIINLGPTRGDDVATARLDVAAGVALPALAERLL